MCTVFVLIFPLSRTVHGAIHELKHGFGRVLKIRSRLNVSARTCRYVSYMTVPDVYSSQKYHIMMMPVSEIRRIPTATANNDLAACGWLLLREAEGWVANEAE